MARAYGSRAQTALAFESTYGVAPASGFIYMPFASNGLSTEQPLIENELIGNGRDPMAPARDAITSDGDIVVPVDAVAIGHWLKALFGAPTTTGTTPKVHTFASGAYDLPSMSIEVQNPEVPSFSMFSGVRANSLRIEAARRGNLQATIGLIAQGETPDTETNAGTPSTVTLQRFGHFNGSIKRDGTALGNITAAEIMYTNNLERIETIRSDGKIDGVDPTVAALTGRITGRFADTTLLDQARAGSACELEFLWSISASLSFKLTAHAVYLPVPRRQINGPGGIEVSFDFQAAKGTSPARLCTAVLTNAVASY